MIITSIIQNPEQINHQKHAANLMLIVPVAIVSYKRAKLEKLT